MRKFSPEQLHVAFELQQMLYDFAYELDHGSENVGRFYAEDGAFRTGGINVEGRAAIQGFYDTRNANVKKYQKDGERTGRHIFTNVRVVFDEADGDQATIYFTNMNFAGEGPAPVQGLGAPSAIADGLMECRRQAGGHWLFTLFAPRQALIGEDDFMKLMLALNTQK
ncbi:MAG: hypothetical protein LBV50_09285 [Novosphingobium sp.]|jgi:hypothetical protein|nr:hypothetical protein [Novosphingobium sp.]